MPSPAFRINGGSVGVKASVSAGATVTATLDSTDGVRSVSWSVIGTDETRTAASYTLTQSGSVGQTVQLTAGAAGTAGILRCEINGGVNLQTEQADATTRATAKWYVPTSGGAEVGCVNEQLESNSTHGWTGIVNAAVRSIGSGGGVTSSIIFSYNYPGGDAAGSNVIERPIKGWDGLLNSTISDGILIPAAAITANNTNYAEFNIYRRADGGGDKALLASFNTRTSGSGGTGNISAFQSLAIVMSDGDVPVFYYPTIEIIKQGGGVAIPPFNLVLYGEQTEA